jgi:hypothetical protein
MGAQADMQMYKQTCRCTNRHADVQTDGWKDIHMDKQIYGQKKRWKDRQMDKKTEGHTY